MPSFYVRFRHVTHEVYRIDDVPSKEEARDKAQKMRDNSELPNGSIVTSYNGCTFELSEDFEEELISIEEIIHYDKDGNVVVEEVKDAKG